MFCNQCGEKINKDDNFCNECGSSNKTATEASTKQKTLKIYNVSRGQLITIVIMSVLATLITLTVVADSYDPSLLGILLVVLIPGATIFYAIGWKKHNR